MGLRYLYCPSRDKSIVAGQPNIRTTQEKAGKGPCTGRISPSRQPTVAHQMEGMVVKRLALVALMLMGGIALEGRLGCLDNSFHLKKCPDFKKYHYVYCTCPCREFTHIDGRDKCLKCGHFHAPLPTVVVQRAQVQSLLRKN